MERLLMFGWVAVPVAGLAVWYLWKRRIDVPCTVQLVSTHDHFGAHVNLEGIEVDPGDSVLVHNAPSRVPFGTDRTIASRATVQRASWLRRQFVKLTGGTEFYELYDVGFEG